MSPRALVADLWLVMDAELAEGPVWDATSGRLSFVDIFRGRLHRTTGSGSVETLVEIDGPLGAALLSEVEDEYLLMTREGFRIRRADGTVTGFSSVLDERPDLRFNDAKCDPHGRCLTGTLSLRDEQGQGSLYRLDPGPVATPVYGPVGLSNGLGWSPDGRSLYFADTFADRVFRFDYDVDSGAVGARHDFVATGVPDGLCVDDDGGVWIARWDNGSVERYTPNGRLDTVVDLPVPHASSCAFMTDSLVITTGRATRPDGRAAAPHAGDLFAVGVGAGAPPAVRWRPLASATAGLGVR